MGKVPGITWQPGWGLLQRRQRGARPQGHPSDHRGDPSEQAHCSESETNFLLQKGARLLTQCVRSGRQAVGRAQETGSRPWGTETGPGQAIRPKGLGCLLEDRISRKLWTGRLAIPEGLGGLTKRTAGKM